MGTIHNVNIESLVGEGIFDHDELIIDKDDITMTTIRREPDTEQIRWFAYDLINNDGNICDVYNNGYGEIDPGDNLHDDYKTKLESAGRW